MRTATDRFKPNGMVESISMGKKLTKKWRIEKNNLCITDSFSEACSEVWRKCRDIRLIRDDNDIGVDGFIK